MWQIDSGSDLGVSVGTIVNLRVCTCRQHWEKGPDYKKKMVLMSVSFFTGGNYVLSS